ncbi:TM2 domain-containing protein [Corynebacterium nuruki]|uniref:TM2 domain-containing protein n=1 Tax=Corynebacterium nuruki TaxID=1032851 RepID=UPI0039BF992A
MSNPYSPDPQQPGFPQQQPQQFGQPQAPQQQFGQPQFGQPQQPQFGQQPFPQNAPQFNQVANYQPGYAPVGYAPKSKIAAALLAFFLGGFGAHNFYLGYKTKAFWQLGLFIFGCITWLFFIGIAIILGLWIWAFIEFIMILAGSEGFKRDANGVPLTS